MFFARFGFSKASLATVEPYPPGETCSYFEVAAKIGRPQAYRAVANANGANQLAIVISCQGKSDVESEEAECLLAEFMGLMGYSIK